MKNTEDLVDSPEFCPRCSIKLTQWIPFVRSIFTRRLTIHGDDNIRGNGLRRVLNDCRTTGKARLRVNGGEIASCERKFDEREGGRTLTNRKERTGWKEERRKILRSSPRLRRDCRGYGKNNAMVAEYFPLRSTTNKSAPVSGFYNWPEVVQLRKRDAGRPPRESSFARPTLSFFLFFFVKRFLHPHQPLSFSMLFAWMFHYGRRRRNDSLVSVWHC